MWAVSIGSGALRVIWVRWARAWSSALRTAEGSALFAMMLRRVGARTLADGSRGVNSTRRASYVRTGAPARVSGLGWAGLCYWQAPSTQDWPAAQSDWRA